MSVWLGTGAVCLASVPRRISGARIVETEGDAMIGSDIVGHAQGQPAVMLVGNDDIINSRK